MPDLPTLTVELDLAPAAGDDDLIFGAGEFGTGELSTGRGWVDVAGDVLAGSIQRGLSRSDRLYATAEAGTLEIDLDNRSAHYDPTNEDSPYWNATGARTELVPMRRIRVFAGDDDSPLWAGFVDSFDMVFPGSGKNAVCTVHATDALKVLGNVQLAQRTDPIASGELTGARITRVLDLAGWPADETDIADGTVELGGTTFGDAAWALMALAAESELGGLYIDPTGKVAFRDRDALANDVRSKYRQAVFGGAGELGYQDVALSYTDENIANEVRITRDADDATTQTIVDLASQAAYLRRTFERTDLPLSTDAEAATYAALVLARLKNPQLAVEQLIIDPGTDATLLQQVFTREIGDRIEVHVSAPGRDTAISRTVFIRGIGHEWDPESWRTTWTLADASYLGDGFQAPTFEMSITETAELAMVRGGAAHTTAIAPHAVVTVAFERRIPPVVVDSASNFTNGTSTFGVPTFPATTPQAGDIYIAICGIGGDGGQPTSVSAEGWTALPDSPSPIGSSGRKQWAFWADAAAAPSTSFVWNVSCQQTWVTVLIRHGKVALPVDSHSTKTGSGTSITSTAFSTSVPGCLLIAMASNDNGRFDTITPPGSMTEIADLGAGNSNNGTRVEVAVETLSASGAVGTRTFTNGGSDQLCLNMVAIAPA